MTALQREVFDKCGGVLVIGQVRQLKGKPAVTVDLPFKGSDGKPLYFYVLRSKVGKQVILSDAGHMIARLEQAAVMPPDLGLLQKLLQSYGLNVDEHAAIFDISKRSFGERVRSMTAGLVAIDAMTRAWGGQIGKETCQKT
jgi:hypothetical protein